MSENNFLERDVQNQILTRDTWMGLETTNNRGFLVGRILEEFQYSHCYCGENYFRSRIAVKRRSGTIDIIPIIIAEETLLQSAIESFCNKYAQILGQICTHDVHDYTICDQKKHYLRIFFLVESILQLDHDQDFSNAVYLRGKICKEPYVKIKSSGIKVVELMVRTIRKGGRRDDYIPCVAFYEVAELLESNYKLWDKIELVGRIQSRKYEKKNEKNPNTFDTRTTYEVAISKII